MAWAAALRFDSDKVIDYKGTCWLV